MRNGTFFIFFNCFMSKYDGLSLSFPNIVLKYDFLPIIKHLALFSKLKPREICHFFNSSSCYFAFAMLNYIKSSQKGFYEKGKQRMQQQ